MVMTILLYFFASLFIVLGFLMLFSFRRTQRAEFLMLSFVYAGSGLAAGYSSAWWPLVVGFAGAWALKLTGFDADRPPASSTSTDDSPGDRPPGSGV